MTENYAPTHRDVVESAQLLAKINAAEEAFQVKLRLEPPAELHGDKGSEQENVYPCWKLGLILFELRRSSKILI
jgi:hypothetical protein